MVKDHTLELTNNINKRLRQHNGILKGGAKATCGRTWKRVCHVSGFSSWSDATKFEWRWKRRSLKKGPLIQKRLVGLTNTFKFPYFVGYELGSACGGWVFNGLDLWEC